MQQKMEEPAEEKDRGEPDTAPRKPIPGKPVPEKSKPAGNQEAKPVSAFQRTLRKAGRTLAVAAVLFVAGMLTAYFGFQRPNVAALESQVSDLNGQVADLEAQVETLSGEVEALQPLEAENRAVQASLSEADLHVRVLSALKDVQAAQLALALGDVDEARLNLSRTEGKLEDMGEMLPADQQGVVDGMVQRLTLVLEGMDTDVFAAQSDLEVLENSLVSLENTLFTGP